MSLRRLAFLMLFLVTLVRVNSSPIVFSNQNPKLSLAPLTSYPLATENFTIDVTISNVTDLSAWRMNIGYNPTVINCVEVTIPADNIFAGHEITGLTRKINNDIGMLTAFNALWELQGVNGSGKLCQIKFNTSFPGISILTFLNSTYLQDSRFINIPFEATEGVVQTVSSDYQLHVFNVTHNETSYKISIYTNSNVTDFNFSSLIKEISFAATNTSDSPSSYTVCVPKAILNETLAVLANGASISYTLSCDNIYRYVHFYLRSNSTIDIQMLATVIGDLSGDRKVDMKDLSIVARAFGTAPGNPRWEPRADIDRNGEIDMKDVTLVAKNFAKTWQN